MSEMVDESTNGVVWRPGGLLGTTVVTVPHEATLEAAQNEPELRERLAEGVRMTFAMADLDWLMEALRVCREERLEVFSAKAGPHIGVRLP